MFLEHFCDLPVTYCFCYKESFMNNLLTSFQTFDYKNRKCKELLTKNITDFRYLYNFVKINDSYFFFLKLSSNFSIYHW